MDLALYKYFYYLLFLKCEFPVVGPRKFMAQAEKSRNIWFSDCLLIALELNYSVDKLFYFLFVQLCLTKMLRYIYFFIRQGDHKIYIII